MPRTTSKKIKDLPSSSELRVATTKGLNNIMWWIKGYTATAKTDGLSSTQIIALSNAISIIRSLDSE